MAFAQTRRSLAGLSVAALATLAGQAQAQVWVVNSADLNTRAEALTVDNGVVTCNIISNFTAPPNPFAAGLLGAQLGQFVAAGCGTMIFTCPLSGYAYGDARIDGVGTPLLHFQWRTWTNARHYCTDSNQNPYRAFGEVMPFNPFISVDEGGVPNGTNLNIDYGWSNRSAAFSRSEAGFEDQPSYVLNTSLTAGSAGDLFSGGGFNFDVVASGFRVGSGAGAFVETVGAPWLLALTGDVRSEINFPGKGFPNKDVAGSYHVGELWMSLDPINFPIPPNIGFAPNPTMKFSVDIGSDTELSPPVFDGNEVFDPGDLYTWMGPALAGPSDGFPDDATIFSGIDPAPDPNAPIGFPNSAPTCLGLPIGQILFDYFDLDGTDCTDFDLSQFVDPIAPNLVPVAGFQSDCVWEATNIEWSYDDDGPSHYTGVAAPIPFCETPTNSLSPITFSTFGTTGADDEVMGALVAPGVVPTPVGAMWGIASEADIHPNLAPNPDLAEDQDDDVDALDFVGDFRADGTPISCPFWYFTADHEAVSFMGLDPGDIYLATAAGPQLAVDAQVHLGIIPGVDIDAFEFVFVRDPQVAPGPVLALLFSVDDDDPLTPADESGGFNPAMIYISYFQGFSVPFLTAPLDDDVDAISVFADIVQPKGLEACCFCDGSCQMLFAADCLNNGGNPQGAGSVCIAGQCETYGACCYGQICVDNETPSNCLNNGGVYQGDCITCNFVQCLPTGACCFACAVSPTPPCPSPGLAGPPCTDNVTQADCEGPLHGVFRGVGTICNAIPGGICRCIGDINGDGVTNAADFNILAGMFGGGIPNCKTHTQGDLNCDGVVNAADFNILAGNFGCQ